MINFKTFYKSRISDELLLEGGTYGHMSHFWDNPDLTFGEIKFLIKEALSGNLDFTEKTDGQALALTYKNGRVGAARNKATIKNPMSAEEIISIFKAKNNPTVGTSFANAVRDIQTALMNIPEDKLNDMFKNGSVFMNAEIINPGSKNVFDYGNKSLIQFHGATEYDVESGKMIGSDRSLSKKLYTILKNAGVLNQKNYSIIGPQKIEIKDIDFSKEISNYTGKINRLMKNLGLNDSSTMKDYLISKWKEFIISSGKIENKDLIDILANRWAIDDKSVNLKIIKSMANENELDFITQTDSNKVQQYNNLLSELSSIILDAGSLLLKNVKGFVASNPNNTINSISNELDNIIKEIKTKHSDDDKLMTKMKSALERLDAIGGKDRIAPLEGVVFMYKDRIYKLTGAFADINQILGLLRYSR